MALREMTPDRGSSARGATLFGRTRPLAMQRAVALHHTDTMAARLQQRVAALQEVAQGRLTVAAAAARLTLSERQVRRLLARYRDGGAAAVQHGNRGRQPAHTISLEVRQRVINLAQGAYRGCSDYQLSILLAEYEGLTLSRSSIRRILRAAGLLANRRHGQRECYCGDAIGIDAR